MRVAWHADVIMFIHISLNQAACSGVGKDTRKLTGREQKCSTFLATKPSIPYIPELSCSQWHNNRVAVVAKCRRPQASKNRKHLQQYGKIQIFTQFIVLLKNMYMFK
jgi:hypothetical protein